MHIPDTCHARTLRPTVGHMQVSVAHGGGDSRVVQLSECKPEELESLINAGIQACRDRWNDRSEAQTAAPSAAAGAAAQPVLDEFNGTFVAGNAAEDSEVDATALQEQKLFEQQRKAARVICRFARYCRSDGACLLRDSVT